MTTVQRRLNDVDIEAVGSLIGAIQEDAGKAQTLWSSTVTWKGGFASEARSRDFAPTQSDEPPSLGGEDAGPNPVEQLLGAFGNCLVVGYAANATAAGIELKDLRIELDGDLDLHTFLGLDDDGHAGFKGIRARVFIDSDADPEAIAGLHDKVTATSPVGHTLTASIPVDVALA